MGEVATKVRRKTHQTPKRSRPSDYFGTPEAVFLGKIMKMFVIHSRLPCRSTEISVLARK